MMSLKVIPKTVLTCLTVVLTLTLTLLQAEGKTLPDNCQDLKPVDGPHGYQPRLPETRCEGLYISNIKAKFQIVSFLIDDLVYDLSADGAILIQRTQTNGMIKGPVHIRAQAIPPGTYYQMDAVLPEDGTMEWPMREVLWPARLKHFHIGLIAWSGEGSSKVFTPLIVRDKQSHQSRKPSRIELLLRTPLDLEAVSWKLPELEEYSNWKPIDTNFPIYAGHCVKIPLPNGPTQKLYLKIAAKPVGSTEWIPFEVNVIRPGL